MTISRRCRNGRRRPAATACYELPLSHLQFTNQTFLNRCFMARGMPKNDKFPDLPASDFMAARMHAASMPFDLASSVNSESSAAQALPLLTTVRPSMISTVVPRRGRLAMSLIQRRFIVCARLQPPGTVYGDLASRGDGVLDESYRDANGPSPVGCELQVQEVSSRGASRVRWRSCSPGG